MFNMKMLCAASAIAVASLSMPAIAADPHAGHHMATPKASKKLVKSPAVKEFIKANEKMHKAMMMHYTGDPDIDFVAGMIPHHQGAVDMANIELKYGKDEKLKALAHAIVVSQTNEISMMQSWINGRKSDYRAPDANERPTSKGLEEAMRKMHKDMNIKYTGNVDVDFARSMIPHHQGAVDMAAAYKPYGKYQQFENLATNIISTQMQEIRLMQKWLENNKSK